MPLFDYKCPVCGKKTSKLVKVYDEKVLCPDCKAEMEKDYSGEVVGGLGKKPSSCTGDCKHCSGCK